VGVPPTTAVAAISCPYFAAQRLLLLAGLYSRRLKLKRSVAPILLGEVRKNVSHHVGSQQRLHQCYLQQRFQVVSSAVLTTGQFDQRRERSAAPLEWKVCVQDNENMRDLTKLNRDLRNVIFIVTESKAKTVQPAENVLVIPDLAPLDSDAGTLQDTTLLDIVPLLELVWKQDVPDTRAVCKSYQGTNVVQEFRRRDGHKASPPAASPGSTAKAPLRRFGFGAR
jgi:hypothetical protein